MRLCPLLALLAAAAWGGALSEGRILEVRMETPSSTRTSRVGDAVQARLVSPVIANGKLLVPAGSVIHGRVSTVDKFGWGIKKANAKIGYRFEWLQLATGETISVDARVVRVDTAREHVDEIGVVHGIAPTVSSSSALAFYAWRLLILEPVTGAAVWGTKLLFAPAPDPEITYPAGTEMLLKTVVPAEIPEPPEPFVRNLDADELSQARRAIESLPEIQVTRNSGELGDRLNLLFIADERDLVQAFAATGWVGAEPRSPKTLFQMYMSVTRREGRTTAPMAPMRWNGLLPDLVFQKSLNTFSRRHHLRLWRTEERVGGKPVWVGSATEDVHIGYSWVEKRWVHQIDDEVDNERAKVIGDLMYTDCVSAVDLIPASAPVQAGIQSDGRFAAARFDGCRSPREMPLSAASKKPNSWARPLVGLSQDFARTNPVTLGLATVRIGPVAKSFVSHQKSKANERTQMAAQQAEWIARREVVRAE